MRNNRILIGVIGVLLLFFLTGGWPLRVVINQPPAIEEITTTPALITIVIDADNSIAINGINVDEGAVDGQVRRLLAEYPQARVAIEAHKRTSAEALTGIIDIVKAAKAEDGLTISELQD